MRILALLIGLFLPAVAFAELESVGGGPGVGGMWGAICSTLPFCGMGAGGVEHFASIIIDAVLSIIAAAAVIVIIYAGIKLIVSQGNDEAIGEAKKITLYALGGLVLALLAMAIKNYVVDTLSVAVG